MKHSIVIFLLALILAPSFGQTKKALSVKDYDAWKEVQNLIISDDGKFAAFNINPQVGDGKLVLQATGSNEKMVFDRGYKGEFVADKYFVFQVQAYADTIRALKLKKKKKEDMPLDSLFMVELATGKITKLPNLVSINIPEETNGWFAYLTKTPPAPKDTTKKADKKKPKAPATDPKTNTLFIVNPLLNAEHSYTNVAEFSISRNADLVSFSTFKRDSGFLSEIRIFNTKLKAEETIFSGERFIKNLTADNLGQRCAYLSTTDTAKRKVYQLFLYNAAIKGERLRLLADTLNNGFPENYTVSENGTIYFSRNDEKLYFGIAEKPEFEEKDTLLPEEKVVMDLWTWKDEQLQPQQLQQLEREKKRTYLSVFHIKTGKTVQLATEDFRDVRTFQRGNADFGLTSYDKPYRISQSWQMPNYRDVYWVDFVTGTKTLLKQKVEAETNLSPNGKYLFWYQPADSSWYAMDMKTKQTVSLTKKLGAIFYDDEHDTPNTPGSQGIAGWTEDDKFILINDKFDIWKCDPTGKLAPQNMTAEFGKKNNIAFRYVELDREALNINTQKPLFLQAFNYTTKDAGYYTCSAGGGNLQLLVMSNHRYMRPIKSQKAEMLLFQRGNFTEYYNVWQTASDFKSMKQISDANPQQDNYLWGTVELVKWINTNGKEVEGLLYKPENFDASKKYPMIVYFYERHSDELNIHFTPRPSRSTIHPTEYVSNGYLVFMPNIHYTTGYPGQDGLDHVVSGTLAMVAKGFVDKDNIGIQGQSWGGYQVAYIVTQTNLFKCANAGAPVANMISAYGGIRWESGMSRMFQYENTQSRIGGTLWERPFRYIENSPIFFVDRINTPLMLRHSDNDGAVPWYQSIELFTAMRRLNKPVWLINYNKGSHNITDKRAEQVDFTIRMKQFFDHYLKGAPAPKWMTEGIPALEKGKEFGY